ncbi:MAG: hypothetical protein ACT4QB_08400 [Gammaproteobacteria bacterium]
MPDLLRYLAIQALHPGACGAAGACGLAESFPLAVVSTGHLEPVYGCTTRFR